MRRPPKTSLHPVSRSFGTRRLMRINRRLITRPTTSDLKESAADLSQLAPDAADAQPTIDPALTGIDFLQHLQTSLTTNTDSARTSDRAVSEDGDAAEDEAAIDGNSLPPVLADASEDEGALLGEAALPRELGPRKEQQSSIRSQRAKRSVLRPSIIPRRNWMRPWPVL